MLVPYSTQGNLGHAWKLPYEGTSEVKEARISLLEQKHHNFKMLHGESIDSMFSCFADIANPLEIAWSRNSCEKSNLQDSLCIERNQLGSKESSD